MERIITVHENMMNGLYDYYARILEHEKEGDAWTKELWRATATGMRMTAMYLGIDLESEVENGKQD